MDTDYSPITPSAKFNIALNKVEKVYLLVLRAMTLIIATILVAYAVWLGGSGLYKVMRSPASIIEELAAVAPEELTSAQLPRELSVPTGDDADAKLSPIVTEFYRNIGRTYFGLYRGNFEPYRQADDKVLSREEFADSFLNISQRMDSIKAGKLDFDSDKKKLEALVAVMAKAAILPATRVRLEHYKAAKKVRVSSVVQKSRTERRAGWDSSSMDCTGWYEEPIGCRVTRNLEIPYSQTVTTMQYPKGTQSHSQIFRAFQDRFFFLLEQRQVANANAADSKRQEIIDGNAQGRVSFFTAIQVLGGFLVLMFFFLLIAIERHQRQQTLSLEE